MKTRFQNLFFLVGHSILLPQNIHGSRGEQDDLKWQGHPDRPELLIFRFRLH